MFTTESLLPVLSTSTSTVKPTYHNLLRYIFYLLILICCLVVIQLANTSNANQIPCQVPRPSSPPDAMLSVHFLKDYYERYSADRVKYFNNIHINSNYEVLYSVLVPEVYCPDIVRVGRVSDGGKWVCNPKAMPQANCSIYSLGLRNDISFDHEIQYFNGNRCKIYGYDMDSQEERIQQEYKTINGQMKRVRISNRTNSTLGESTLTDLLKENGGGEPELLKIDIEGGEYVVLMPFLEQHKPCQIFIEAHGSAWKMRLLLGQISSQGYRLFHYEVNGNTLWACEYSFIHDSCLERYGTFRLASYISPPSERKK